MKFANPRNIVIISKLRKMNLNPSIDGEKISRHCGDFYAFLA